MGHPHSPSYVTYVADGFVWADAHTDVAHGPVGTLTYVFDCPSVG